jgi:hypothetical protein
LTNFYLNQQVGKVQIEICQQGQIQMASTKKKLTHS